MSETPRIVFTLFSAHTDSMVAAWQRFSADLLPDLNAPLAPRPSVRLAADRSTAVRLPVMSRGSVDRGVRHPSLRALALPPRREGGVSTSPSNASSSLEAPSGSSLLSVAATSSATDLSGPAGRSTAGATAAAQAGLGSGGTIFSSSERLRGDNAPPAPLGGVWRLLATNNREIARSVRVYPSFPEARADVDRICASPDSLAVAAVVGPDRGTRGWYATLDGEAVITCSRWYETSSSSIAASADAIEALRTVLIVDAVRTIEDVDRRRSRARARVTETSVVGW